MKQKDLHKIFFNRYGYIVSLKISLESNHRSRGFGYILFKEKEQA